MFPTVKYRIPLFRALLVGVWLPVVLAACGSGGSGSGGGDDNSFFGPAPPGPGSDWSPGVFLPASSFANQCAAPRSGTNPDTGNPYADVQGTADDENNFLRSWSNNTYLWYDEIIDRDPAQYPTPDYFDLLRTTATTTSGADKDKFHFTYPTDEWFDLSQSGVSAGYGLQWVLLASMPPREVLVAFTEPNTPATDAELFRGAEVLAVDSEDMVNGSDIVTLNAGLFPATAGETHDFSIRDPDGTVRDVTLTSETIVSAPVQDVQTIPTATGPVGYLFFNDHIATAEGALISAISTFQAQNVTDLVLDIRYNGGGYLYIASELAYMVAGNDQTDGRTFENLTFNDKHPTTDPVTGEALEPIPFYNSSTTEQNLPSLNLSRVFVLTGPGTCSASESIMNSLRGVDVEVIQIGSTTCGKPYGFYPQDNCGTTYFTIQFRGENNKAYGDYADGFAPQNAGNSVEPKLPGCQVADDFSTLLGDPTEARLAAALAYRMNPTCPTPSSVRVPGAGKPGAPAYRDADMRLPRSPLREMRLPGRRP